MKQRKVVSMIGALVVLISAVFMMTGCSQTVGVKLPDDLRNTSWSYKMGIGGTPTNSITLEFGTNTLKYTEGGTVANLTITSATKGGKIVSSAAGTELVLCESYSISGNTLTMSGGILDIGFGYTKQ
jgi:lipoprotein